MPNYTQNYAYGGAPKRKVRYGRTDPKSRKRPTGVTVKDPSDYKATTKGRTSENRARPAQSVNRLKKARRLREKIQADLRKDEKGLGGLIGTGLGAIGGSFLGNPMLGAKIGGAAGGLAESALTKKEPQRMKTRGSGMLIDGGFVNDVPQMLDLGGAVKFQGPSHEQGGIDIGDNTEVEGQETMDVIDGDNYVFSKRLKVPGTYKTFAKYHEDLINSGADINTIKELAELQESVSGRRRQP